MFIYFLTELVVLPWPPETHRRINRPWNEPPDIHWERPFAFVHIQYPCKGHGLDVWWIWHCCHVAIMWRLDQQWTESGLTVLGGMPTFQGVGPPGKPTGWGGIKANDMITRLMSLVWCVEWMCNESGFVARDIVIISRLNQQVTKSDSNGGGFSWISRRGGQALENHALRWKQCKWLDPTTVVPLQCVWNECVNSPSFLPCRHHG